MSHHRSRRRHVVTKGGLTLPRAGLLLSIPLPNAYLPIDWDEEIGWESPMRGYQATPGDDALFAAAPQLYDGDVDSPLILSDAEILALSGINTTINGIEVSFSVAAGLAVRWHRVAYIPNAYPFTDRDGDNTRTLYGLQYLSLAGATDFTNASIVGTETVTSQPSGTATITVAAGKLTIGAGDLWSFALSNGSTYEFGTILTATTGVVFDTSGNGRHLLFSVADTSVVCLSGREKGSDWLDTEGWVKHFQNGQELHLPIFSSFTDNFNGKLAPVIKVWGDSLTLGTSPKLREIYKYTDIIGGVGGQESDDISDRFLAAGIKGDISVLWPGNNNPLPPSTVIGHVNEMIAALEHDKFLVCSLLVNAVHAIDSATYVAVMDYNAQQSATFGSRYIDILGELIANYDPESPQDVLDVAKGITPSSLRVDDIHLNATGYGIVAAKILSTVRSLGWLDGAMDYITPGFLSAPSLIIGASSAFKIYKDGISVTLTGSDISTREGTTDLAIVDGTNRIACSGGGILYNLYIKLTNGEVVHFPFCEGSGSTAFGYSQDGHYVCTIHAPVSLSWGWQNTYIHTLIHGYGIINSGVLLPERNLPSSDVDFSSESGNWAEDGGWEISGGIARHTGTTAGTLTKTNVLCKSATFLCGWDVLEYGGVGIIGLGGSVTSGGYFNSVGTKSKEFVGIAAGIQFYTTADCVIDNVSVRERTTASLSVGGNPYTALDAFGGSIFQAYYSGSAKQNITRTSGTGTTLEDAGTYTLPDSHTFRTSIGWAYGVDHWAYTSLGVPKEVSGAVIKTNGAGLRWYVGTKGLALYPADQTVKDAKIKKYLKVPA